MRKEHKIKMFHLITKLFIDKEGIKSKLRNNLNY